MVALTVQSMSLALSMTVAGERSGHSRMISSWRPTAVSLESETVRCLTSRRCGPASRTAQRGRYAHPECWRAASVTVLCLLVCSLLATPLAAQTQPAGKIWRIGFLSVQTSSVFQTQLNAFRQKLRDLGYVEGQTLVIEYRWAEGRYERLRAMATELAQLKVDLILTPDGTPPTPAAKAATRTIPIVFFAGTPSSLGSWR